MAEYDVSRHWYEIIEGESLRQGDLFRNLAAFRLSEDLTDPGEDAREGVEIRSDRFVSDWIIISASCDLDSRKLTHALVARVAEGSKEALKTPDEKDYHTKLEVMRRDFAPRQFLLPPCSLTNPAFPLSVVDWTQQCLLPVAYLVRASNGPRIRLRHPFREKLGAWAGSALARVGPENEALVPPFRPSVFPAQILKYGE